ncbi:hypothetical protein ACU7M0_37680, partial [Burkholderia cenocepacia]
MGTEVRAVSDAVAEQWSVESLGVGAGMSRASYERHVRGKEGMRGVKREKGWKGVWEPARDGKVGVRGWSTGEIVLDEVCVTDENMMANVSGLGGTFKWMNTERYGIAWG